MGGEGIIIDIFSLVIGGILGGIIRELISWIIGKRGRHRYNLYKKRKDVINRLKECVKKSSLEKLKKCETARNFNSDIGRILPKKSKLKFEEFCRKIEGYNIMRKCASMKVHEIMNKHIFITKDNESKILSNIRREIRAINKYESFCDFFYENFHEEFMKRILDNEKIDKRWFVRDATGKYRLKLETKEKIVDLIEEGQILKCSCGYKKAYEGEKNCPNCSKKLELDEDIERISFEGILEKIEKDLKKDEFIHALKGFRKDAISASEKLIEAIEKDLKLLRFLWPFLGIEESDLENVERKLKRYRQAEAEFM